MKLITSGEIERMELSLARLRETYKDLSDVGVSQNVLRNIAKAGTILYNIISTERKKLELYNDFR